MQLGLDAPQQWRSGELLPEGVTNSRAQASAERARAAVQASSALLQQLSANASAPTASESQKGGGPQASWKNQRTALDQTAGSKGGKGLRHFSLKVRAVCRCQIAGPNGPHARRGPRVQLRPPLAWARSPNPRPVCDPQVCEKVESKGRTSYNEVADELVAELSAAGADSGLDGAFDDKNVRRRVYDALNVLMAMVSPWARGIEGVGRVEGRGVGCWGANL
jgi:hypothetical protein